MGYDLSRRGDSYDGDGTSFNCTGWASLLRIGEEGGWEPAGTVVGGAMCSSGYFMNEGQTVSSRDAREWADAVETQIAEEEKKHGAKWGKMLRGFVKFARRGAFQIN